MFRLARAGGTQAQGQTADLEPLGDEAVRLRQPGTLQQRSRVAHHLMQGACLFKGVQASLGLACPGQLEDGAVHGRFEMAQQTGPPFLEALAHVFRHPVISCPPVEDGQGVPDGPGIRGGRAQGLDERVTGPAPFLPVHVRGQVGFGQPVQQQAGPAAAVPLRQLVQTFGQLAVQAGDVPYLAACLPDALPERVRVGDGRIRRGAVPGGGPLAAFKGGQFLPDEVCVDAAEILPLLPYALRRVQMTQGQRADIVQGAADGPAHLFVHLMLDMGKAVRIGRQPVLQDGVHGFQGRLQGVPGLARETGQHGLAFLQCLPRFCLEVEAAQEEVPQGGGAETGAIRLRGRWGRRDIERCGGSRSQVGGPGLHAGGHVVRAGVQGIPDQGQVGGHVRLPGIEVGDDRIQQAARLQLPQLLGPLRVFLAQDGHVAAHTGLEQSGIVRAPAGHGAGCPAQPGQLPQGRFQILPAPGIVGRTGSGIAQMAQDPARLGAEVFQPATELALGTPAGRGEAVQQLGEPAPHRPGRSRDAAGLPRARLQHFHAVPAQTAHAAQGVIAEIRIKTDVARLRCLHWSWHGVPLSS